MSKDSFTTIIFDFDGTIADSFKQTLQTTINISEEYGVKGIDKNLIKVYRNKDLREIIKESKIPVYRLPFIIKKGQKEISKIIKTVKPFEGMIKLLLLLKKRGVRLGILTSNTEYNVKQFLINNKIDVFDFVYSGSSIFGKAKILKKVIKSKKLIPQNTLFVGDETRDIQAAKENGVKSAAVSWGFNTSKLLLKSKPDYLIKRPSELLDILS
jgi:phosphoglycolate phosphatase